ncbi:nucleotidyltransferase family protein [Chloroflexota bacterium]
MTMVVNANQSQSKEAAMPKRAVVLAGGLGTRLQDAVADRPKVLAPAAGRPFLNYLMRYLASEGLNEVILSTGYLADQVSNYAGNGDRWGISVHYSREDKPLGTAGALRQAGQQFGLSSYFALNGDTLFLVNLKNLWQTHIRLGARATIALRTISAAEGARRGCVRLANDGRIVAFDEKPALKKALPASSILASGGIYVMERSALAVIEPGQTASIERQVFPLLAEQGRLAGYIQDGYFADIGTPESLASFEKDVETDITGLSGIES